MYYDVNPMQLVAQIKQGKNPQQMMLKILESQAQGNPVMSNLLTMAKENLTADIEKFARNLAASQGLDFDKEFTRFRKQYFGR